MLTADTLETRYTKKKGRVFLNGSQALARLPMLQRDRDLAAGLNTAGFISGYRGSPLGGLDKTLWQAKDHLQAHHIHFQPGVNEDLAATAVWGSQQVNVFEGACYDGVFAMWYGKGPGVDRSGDAFRHANHAGTSRHGGVLVVAGDDHACKSSTLPHQTEYAFVDAMIPVLSPAGVQEIIDLGLFGWAMSRYSGCWVALKTLSETVDASFTTEIDPERVQIVLPEGDRPDLAIRWPDKDIQMEARLHNEKIAAALAFCRVNRLNRVVIDHPSPVLGIITHGKSYLDVLQALDDLGVDAAIAEKIGLRVYKIGMPWPLEPEGVREFASGLSEILVVEEKRGLIEEQLTSQLYNWDSALRPVIVGKKDEQGRPLLPSTGELTPAVVARAIASRLSAFYQSEAMDERLRFLNEKEKFLHRPKDVISRTPHFCSGCPHNTSTKVPEGSRAMGGIGCHYMATWMERQTDTFTQMGGEGATWIGQAPFTETRHVFQNLGDGTYFHSGLLAIRAAIASGVNITYKILYNDAVAMTGGQPVDGQMSVAQMSHQLVSEGIKRLAIVSDDLSKYRQLDYPAFTEFHHRDDLDALQHQLREEAGTTVLIYDQTCAAEKRRRRKKGLMPDPAVRAYIHPLVCEGCGDCGMVSNCLSILPHETEYGRKRRIDQDACNKDMSCINGFCPSFVTVEGGELVRPKASAKPLDFSILPEPELPDYKEHPYSIVLAGVGGTGVTTLGAILGMAAHLESKGASLLDMTGLAQKFGAVITHLQISDDPEKIYASRIAAGGARLLIGCDLVVAAANDSTVKLNPEIAHAVVNTHVSMTAEFTRNPDSQFPGEAMKAVIAESAGEDNTVFIEVNDLISSLQGSTSASNIFLAGYAWQLGLIPVSAEAIERAIELNGVAIEQNKQAFQFGRYYAHDPETINEMAGNRPVEFKPLSQLDDIVDDRVAFLSDYQNSAYAQDYRELVKRVSERDKRENKPLAVAVAKNWFKLLAIKDEYEVARLFSLPQFREGLDHQFQGNYRMKFHLATPLLAKKDKQTGLPRKRAFGGWMLPLFHLLQHLKFLRGTVLDPFSYSRERKMEKAFAGEYANLIHSKLEQLHQGGEENYELLLRIANVPERVRGYGHIKVKSITAARQEIDRLLSGQHFEQPVRLVTPEPVGAGTKNPETKKTEKEYHVG